MQILMEVATATKRTEQSVGGGGVETTVELMDVRLIPMGGDPWRGSPAGQMSLTLDDPAQFGFFEEGAIIDLTAARQS